MRHLTQPNRWSCLPTSFAMACGLSVEDFIKLLGHDGSEIIHPDLNDPWCRRAFHMQECIWVVARMGFSVTPFEEFPELAAVEGYQISIPRGWDYDKVMSGFGVITGRTERNRHAIAYNHAKGFDPNGSVIDFQNQTEFQIETVWKFDLIS